MRRKITRMAIHAFLNGYNLEMSNTRVCKNSFSPADMELYLFDNLIAWTSGNDLYFNLRGRDSNTTIERLKGLGLNIYRKNYQVFYNNTKIDINATIKAVNNELILIRA